MDARPARNHQTNQNRTGNRYLVKFDTYELGMWHDEDGEPVLRLGDSDLILVAADLNSAA